MASTDARPVPEKNVAYRVTFPILDGDGDLVSGAAGLDSEISKDAGAFADCTNEATEIAASSGMYYLDLTATEMNADTVAVIVKTTTTGAKTTPIVLYPEEAGDIRVNLTQCNGNTVAAGAIPNAAADAAGGLPVSDGGGLDLDAILADTNELQGDWVNGGRLDLLLDLVLADTGELQTDWVNGGRLDLILDAILADTAVIGAAGAGLTDLGGMSTAMKAEVNAEADTALTDYDPPTRTEATADKDAILAKLLNYVQLLVRSDAAIATDNATEVTAINADEGSGAGDFANTTDSQEAIRDKQTDIETDTAVIGAAGAGLTAIPWNAAWDAEVQSEATDALNAYDPPTRAELTSDIGSLNDPTAAVIADAVWDEARAGHVAAGSFGQGVASVQGDVTGNVDGSVGSLIGHTVQTGDSFARLGAPAGASVSADIAAVKADTAAILIDTAVIGAAGAGLTAVPWNAAWDAEVQSEATDALNAYDPPTRTELTSDIAGLNDPTAAAIADAVWDEAVAGHVAGGSFGAEVQSHALSSEISALNDVSAAAVNAEVVDVLRTDTLSELSQAAPTATPTFAAAVMLMYMTLRNKLTTTATEKAIYNDAGTKIAKKDLTDDGTTYTEAEMDSGA
jgi:phage baseplate assembly protein W